MGQFCLPSTTQTGFTPSAVGVLQIAALWWQSYNPCNTNGEKYGFHLFSTLRLVMNIIIRERDDCVEATQHSNLRSQSKLTSCSCYYFVVNTHRQSVNFFLSFGLCTDLLG